MNKRDLQRYFKEQFLPGLGKEWQLIGSEMLVRRFDLIVQGLYFDRSSYGERFVPNYFIQVLAIPQNHFVMQLGSRLQDKRRAELWLDWAPKNQDVVKTIQDAYNKQADPPLDQPLSFENVINYIEKAHRKSKHFYTRWSLGILYGLRGRVKEGRKQFQLAMKDLEKRATTWKKAGKVPPESNVKYSKLISYFLSKVENIEDFRTFCFQQAEKTVTALKL